MARVLCSSMEKKSSAHLQFNNIIIEGNSSMFYYLHTSIPLVIAE